MYILGINAFHGDSSACLLKNGEILCAIEEERFTRVKHWAGIPLRSIEFCLADSKISIQDLDYIAISRDPNTNLLEKVMYSIRHRFSIRSIKDRLFNANKIWKIKHQLSIAYNLDVNDIKAKVYHVEHHRSHIASSFFASSFKNAAILSIDGFGDFTSTMTAVGQNNDIKVLDRVKYPHSLGIFYTAATQFLGFLKYGDEYKVMGLSSYGEPKYLSKLSDIVMETSDGLFKLNKKYFTHIKEGVKMEWDNGEPSIDILYTKEWIKLFGNPRNYKDKIEDYHMDLASSFQKFIEEKIFYILHNLYHKTSLKHLCITGGVSQNSVLNGKIIENTPFEKIYIPSAGHDAGTSIGASLYLYHDILRNPRKQEIRTAYFGKEFSKDDIISCLEENSISYKEEDDRDLYEMVCDCLINGGVVGWFQGRSEFGPRALGNRSILVDPRRKDAKEILNKKIKRREDFRPFAPSIIKEKISDYFEQDQESLFMDKVFLIKEEKQKEIPSVTHVDGTGRLQTVDKSISPRYHKLISVFAERTGTPILLNTSFNENEPIVNTPNQALDCFLRTKMDMLVMENIIIKR